MFAPILDSRMSLGSDMTRQRITPRGYEETTACLGEVVLTREVRVVVAYLGGTARLSAPELGIVVDASTIEQGWNEFLRKASERADAAWLTFDVGPTRPEEVAQALDADEAEDWAEPVDPGGDG